MIKENIFDYEMDADLPNHIYFMYFDDMVKMKYRFAGLHIHQSVELVIVEKGKMRCKVNDDEKELGPGEVLIVNSYDSHFYEYVGNATVYILVIGKEFMHGVLSSGNEFNNFIRLGEVSEEVFSFLHCSFEKFDKYNLLQKRGFVNMLFGQLYDKDLFRRKTINSNKELFIRVCQYIAENYDKDITIDSISRDFGYSKNYFSTLFNKNMGVGFNDYLNRFRLRKVFEKREEYGNRYKIQNLITECGFKSTETYYRALRQYKQQNDVSGNEE